MGERIDTIFPPLSGSPRVCPLSLPPEGPHGRVCPEGRRGEERGGSNSVRGLLCPKFRRVPAVGPWHQSFSVGKSFGGCGGPRGGVEEEWRKINPCSDFFRLPAPAATPEILHHTVWRTRLFIAYSDERWLYHTNSHYLIYTSLFKRLGECNFWTLWEWEWKGN